MTCDTWHVTHGGGGGGDHSLKISALSSSSLGLTVAGRFWTLNEHLIFFLKKKNCEEKIAMKICFVEKVSEIKIWEDKNMWWNFLLPWNVCDKKKYWRKQILMKNIKLKPWQSTNCEKERKLDTSNCEKIQKPNWRQKPKKSNCDQTWNLKLWQNPKTQTVIKLRKSDTWHVTRDNWHATHGGGWIFSQKSQLSSSYVLGLMMSWRLGEKGLLWVTVS